MIRFFNDSPIEKAEDDRYGITPFAELLAKSISSIQAPVGTTIALHGPWGSGKSSAVNIIRHKLESADDETLVISDFKCWWYKEKGEEALVLAFLQNLNALLTNTFKKNKVKKKVKKLVPQLGRHLLPAIGSAVAMTTGGLLATLLGSVLAFVQWFFLKGDTLEKVFYGLVDVLNKGNRRFLIIIDDIDRLSPEEALAVFRTVKSVGCLPNVIYLLVFDRALAEKTVTERYPSEGPHFLEKIIQASFELPAPLQTDLNHAVLSAIQEICGDQDEAPLNRFWDVFHDVVVPYMKTPRHAVRFQNAISVTWPAIKDEVSLADFIALETLRLYEPSLFQAIRFNKLKLVGWDRQLNLDQEKKVAVEPFLKEVKEEFYQAAKSALQKLFPRMENFGYSSDFNQVWNAERRVCVEAHFDTYFRLFLSDEALPMERINEFIEKADNRDFIQTELREAAASLRKSDTSMVPVILDELNAHASNIPKEKVEPLLSALFEIHDEIDLDIDKRHEMMPTLVNTTLRYHWLIRRLTDQRFTLPERTKLYMNAVPQASLGWLVEFVSSAKHDPDRKSKTGGPLREEDHLVQEGVIGDLVKHALKAIRLSAANGSLLNHRDLMAILYRWRYFLDNDPSEVRAWTDSQLENDATLVTFARELTGETLSHRMGERIPRRNKQVRIEENTGIFDMDRFCSRLEALQEAGTLDEEKHKIVEVFLETWRKREKK